MCRGRRRHGCRRRPTPWTACRVRRRTGGPRATRAARRMGWPRRRQRALPPLRMPAARAAGGGTARRARRLGRSGSGPRRTRRNNWTGWPRRRLLLASLPPRTALGPAVRASMGCRSRRGGIGSGMGNRPGGATTRSAATRPSPPLQRAGRRSMSARRRRHSGRARRCRPTPRLCIHPSRRCMRCRRTRRRSSRTRRSLRA